MNVLSRWWWRVTAPALADRASAASRTGAPPAEPQPTREQARPEREPRAPREDEDEFEGDFWGR